MSYWDETSLPTTQAPLLVRPPLVKPFGLTAVELKDSKDPGESATGWKLSWDFDSNEWSEPDYESDTDVTVYDGTSTVFALGYDDTPTGVRGCIVFVDGRNSILSGGLFKGIGKLTQSLSAGSSASMDVWLRGASTEENTGVSVTVTRDWIMKSGAAAIASGKKVFWTLIMGTFYVSEAECP